MNVIQFELCAFIMPDDMDAFRKRYGADIIYVDAELGSIFGIGPNDKEWRELPTNSTTGPTVIPMRKDNG